MQSTVALTHTHSAACLIYFRCHLFCGIKIIMQALVELGLMIGKDWMECTNVANDEDDDDRKLFL